MNVCFWLIDPVSVPPLNRYSFVRRTYRGASDAKKKSLFRTIGPPSDAPTSCRSFFCSSSCQYLTVTSSRGSRTRRCTGPALVRCP